jgi:hypothetical protein
MGNKTGRIFSRLLVLVCFNLMSGCGGGGGSNGVISLSPTVTATETVQIANASLSLNATNVPVTATFLDLSGNPIPNVQVTFSTNLGSLNPASGLATTNASGIATVQLSAGSTSGAGVVTASATVTGTKLSKVATFSVALPQLTISTPVLGLGSLAPDGSTSVTVNVTDAFGAPFTTPVDVTFSSDFASSGKATLISPVRTVNGIASSTYTAKGGVGTDTITAFIGGNASTPVTLTVAGSTANSISFVSATPTNIALSGMGGVGSSATSTVVFTVLDTNRKPKAGQTVDFSLNTTVGGLALTSTSSSSAEDGTVSTIVQSGVVATPVRVTASIRGSSPLIATQSDQLVVSTGIPAQAGMSLAVATHNVEAATVDGTTDVFTVFLADHFGNPVPDLTTVSFVAQTGQITSSCTTVNGRCSATWTSSGDRIADGRAAILAYAIGEESFSDLNGTGLAEGPSSIVCLGLGPLQSSATCGEFTDSTQAWRDDAHIGIYAPPGTSVPALPNFPGDFFVDFNHSGKVDRDGLFNGVLRPLGSAGTSTKHVFQNNVIVMSTSTAKINNFNLLTLRAATVDGPATSNRFASVQDTNSNEINPMPSGSKIDIASLSSCLTVAPSSFVVPNTTLAPTGFSTVVTNTCLPGISSPGTLSVTVTSPGGMISIRNFDFTW